MNNNCYKVTQLNADLWAIEDIVSSENSICYLLTGKNKALLFDTGLGLSPILPTIREITQLPLVVCLSHWHFDHSGGAHEFDSLIAWKSKRMMVASRNGVSSKTVRTQAGQTFLDSLEARAFQTKGFHQVQLVSHEQVIDLGGYKLKLLHTPGHTKDSICLHESDQGWLFSGDTIYPGPIYLQFDDSDVEDYENSIKRLLNLRIATIYPGHNIVQTDSGLLHEVSAMLAKGSHASEEFSELRFVLK